MKLTDKVAIITGAASGIGKATAITLAEEGATTIIVDINEEAAKNTCNDILHKYGKAKCYIADIRNSKQVYSLVDDVISQFGSVDILVNNAGGPADLLGNDEIKRTRFIDSSVDTWRLVLDVNLLGTMTMTHAVLANMMSRRKGKIVNIGSVAGVNGLVKMVDYSASKGGVISFTRALAIEVGEYHINVNCVSPGSIDTRRGGPPTFLKKLGQPQDVANLVLFLSSFESDFITGQNYIIDGGRVLSTRCE